MSFDIKVYFSEQSALAAQEFLDIDSFTTEDSDEFLLLFNSDSEVPVAMIRNETILYVTIEENKVTNG